MQKTITGKSPENDPWYCEALFIQSDSLPKNQAEIYNYELLSAASFLKQNNVRVKYIKNNELTDFSPEQRKFIISQYNANLIFINIEPDNIYNSVKLAEEIKTQPNIKIAALCAGSFEFSGKSIFDFIISGESETASLKLYNRLTGVITKPDKETFAEIPPVDIALSESFCTTYYYSSRTYNGKQSFYSAARVADDIINIVRTYGTRHIIIADKSFMSDYERLCSICEILAEETFAAKISCMGDIKILAKHPELAGKLAKAHISVILLDIKTVAGEALDVYGSGITKELITKAIENVTSIKRIIVSGRITIGNPMEAVQSFEENLSFCKRMIEKYAGFFEAFPSFLSEEENIKSGLYPKDKDFFRRWGEFLPIYKTDSLTIREISRLRNLFVKKLFKISGNCLKKIPFATIAHHLELRNKYGINTLFGNTTDQYPIFEKYFQLAKLPRFKRLNEIPPEETADWIPLSPVKNSHYIRQKNGYIINEYVKRLTLSKEIEIAIYDYCSGKLNIGDIAERICCEQKLNFNREEFIKKHMIPFYKKLEKYYYVAFYR